jgi:hypothetical protein
MPTYAVDLGDVMAQYVTDAPTPYDAVVDAARSTGLLDGWAPGVYRIGVTVGVVLRPACAVEDAPCGQMPCDCEELITGGDLVTVLVRLARDGTGWTVLSRVLGSASEA